MQGQQPREQRQADRGRQQQPGAAAFALIVGAAFLMFYE